MADARAIALRQNGRECAAGEGHHSKPAAPAYHLVGEPRAGGILIVADHASDAVPSDIALGVSETDMRRHIACDLGVEALARSLVASGAAGAAFLGGVSRLVCDFNRAESEAQVLPEASDGTPIPGNKLDADQREARLARYYRPYHGALADLLQNERPAFILSLHSFTPQLLTRPGEARPWVMGVLYNEDGALAREALEMLPAIAQPVGDQQPYSGRDLNHTMNIHAEANAIPYFGLEIRQDQLADAAGVQRYAQGLGRVLAALAQSLAQGQRDS